MKAYFVIDDAGEAEGTAYHFCGEYCRERFARNNEDNLKAGESDDAGIVDGEECDYCGQQLPSGGAA